MADSVQYALDRMVVDLEDLRYRGIFSEAEVRAIVAKRREFEYMLRRHEARRLDFMRYVEYELNLESLRALRTKRVEGASGGGGNHQSKKKKTKKGKAATADFCCVRLVRWIFDRAVMKFPGDVDIWLHYIDFAARQGQSKTLGRLFARALQLHPRNPGLWIKAASWEFFDGGNASSARSLLQRALRINPEARNLWLQYFRLEFSYVEKLMGRREILGLEEEGNGAGAGREGMDIPELEAEEGQSGGPSFTAVQKAAAAAAAEAGAEAGAGAWPGGDGGGATVGGDGSSRPAPVMNDTARLFYKGAVPMAVFRAAIGAVPEDVGFRSGFLRCCAVDFPALAGDAAQSVLASIERDFPESCEAWELRASYPLLVAEAGGAEWGVKGGGGDGLGPAGRESVATFESAVEAVGTSDPGMWVRYAAFLRGRLEACEEREERKGGGGKKRKKSSSMVQSSAPAAAAAALAARLKEVLARAVVIHLSPSSADDGGSLATGEGLAPTTTTVVTAAIAARKERGGASLLATRGVSTSAGELEAAERRRTEDAREALSAGLADVCLALGEPEEALVALRSATRALPQRPGPWLRRAALERRLAAVSGGDQGAAIVAAGAVGGGAAGSVAGGGGSRLASRRSSSSSSSGSSSSGSTGDSDAPVAIATLRAGLKAVPTTAPDYPNLWRELIASLAASGSCGGGGGGSKKHTVAAAFRAAVEACNPTGGGGGDPAGTAQGEFLAGYIRWAAAVEGVGAARRALQWARRSFLLSGEGAAAAYNEAIELERALGEVGGHGGGRAKRVRELFEDAAEKFGKKMPGIWQEYVDFEIQEGDVKRANTVRWRSQQQQ